MMPPFAKPPHPPILVRNTGLHIIAPVALHRGGSVLQGGGIERPARQGKRAIHPLIYRLAIFLACGSCERFFRS